MNNSFLDRAVEELEVALQIQEDKESKLVLKEETHCDIYNVIKRPKVFEKVEYSPCVTIIDNR